MPILLQPSSPPTPRRHYSAQFKARILAQCQHDETLVTAVAREHGINANFTRGLPLSLGQAPLAVLA